MSVSKAIDRLLMVIAEFRKMDPSVQTDTINVFCLIVKHPGITSRQIHDMTGMSQSAISRHIAELSDINWKKEPGMGLVETFEDLADRRAKCGYLTHKGRTVAAQVVRLLDPLAEADVTDFPTARDARRRGAR